MSGDAEDVGYSAKASDMKAVSANINHIDDAALHALNMDMNASLK